MGAHFSLPDVSVLLRSTQLPNVFVRADGKSPKVQSLFGLLNAKDLLGPVRGFFPVTIESNENEKS